MREREGEREEGEGERGEAWSSQINGNMMKREINMRGRRKTLHMSCDEDESITTNRTENNTKKQ